MAPRAGSPTRFGWGFVMRKPADALTSAGAFVPGADDSGDDQPLQPQQGGYA